jgi:hypothetical protein
VKNRVLSVLGLLIIIVGALFAAVYWHWSGPSPVASKPETGTFTESESPEAAPDHVNPPAPLAPAELRSRFSSSIQTRLSLKKMDDAGRFRDLYKVQIDGIELQNAFVAMPKTDASPPLEISHGKLPLELGPFPDVDEAKVQDWILSELNQSSTEVLRVWNLRPRWSYEGHRVFASYVAWVDYKDLQSDPPKTRTETWTLDVDERKVVDRKPRNRH